MAEQSAPEEKAEATKAVTTDRAPSPPRPPTEDEIDSPDKKTLTLLFVVFAVTVGSWGAARFACNMHPPESRGAPKLATERLLGSAKDGAIEFIERYRSSDFDGALEASTGDLALEVAQKKADCDKRANECAREREAAAGRLTTAVVEKTDGFVADTHVVTTLKGTTEKYRVLVKRDGMIWKAATLTRE